MNKFKEGDVLIDKRFPKETPILVVKFDENVDEYLFLVENEFHVFFGKTFIESNFELKQLYESAIYQLMCENE